MGRSMEPQPDAEPHRWASARHPFIYEINTWPWLAELGERTGMPVDLATVPNEQWDAIAEAGFDAVWLMGVWERSPAGTAVALENADLVAAFAAALPDWTPDDVVGSAYCIRSYEVDRRLGGRTGLAAARAALAARGMALILDFVPNHVASDHPWTTTHPEYFVQGTSADLRAEPESFTAVGQMVLANGKDPYFPAWRDVVQLNTFSPAVRAAMVSTLHDIAEQCDGVRCDMAMLMMNDIFTRTWGDRVGVPPAEDYWPLVIGAVRLDHPDFCFIAEAYWDREWALQQQGFDFCYDKRLYDGLVARDPAAVREHLRADVEFQDRLLRFMENHDEARAASVYDLAQHKAVALATLTQSGARLVQHGQLEGRTVHVPVFLGRSPREDSDPDVVAFYHSLLEILRDSIFRTGTWSLCETSGSEHVVSWCWDGEQRWLIVVNLSAATTSGQVRVPWHDVGARTFRLSDPLNKTTYTRSPAELDVELGPWQWHLFRVEQIT